MFKTRWIFVLLLFVLVGCGAFLRFSDLSAPLLDFHPTRQLFSAIKARGLYYQFLSTQPAGAVTQTASSWQEEMAVRQYEGEATIEPPLMEHLTAFLYRYFGEQTAIPRAISASFWLLGGLFLFLLAKNLSNSAIAAGFGLAFYLLSSYAVTASRAFQPDPLMILLLLVFWWSIENWSRKMNWHWSILSGLSGGLAIFIKFPAAFFVIVPALGIMITRVGLWNSVKNPKTWLIIFLGILPPAAYLFYGTFMGGFLGQQFGSRFYPELWISPYFYLRWFLKLEIAANAVWIALALLGTLVFSRAQVTVRSFLGSLWLAYLVFGMTFAHHISSHDYYSLPIIPIVALGLAQLAAFFLPGVEEALGCDEAGRGKDQGQEQRLKSSLLDQRQRLKSLLQIRRICLILLFGTLLLVTTDGYINQRTSDNRLQAAFWAKVGNAVGHQPGVIALTTDYGYPLAYYGWQNSSPWPASVDISNYDKTFSRLTANKDYFLVTDFTEYDLQPDLQKILTTKYPVLVDGRDFIVFDLSHPMR